MAQGRVAPNITFQDFDIAFSRHPIKKSLSLKKNDNAVKQSVKNILLSNMFERPYKPDYGGNIRAMLFENFDPMTEQVLRKRIEEAIGNYEPRVDLEEVKIDAKEDENALDITVKFTTINQIEPTEVTVSVERTR
tara:strand:+ start:193 stop:597 length:405 start_codon:yes stop_codon:yes gene_type:complete